MQRRDFLRFSALGAAAATLAPVPGMGMTAGTAWLSEHVLGIEPVEPGFKTVRIDPHLGDLEWAEGTFPTPYGLIEVRHQKNADGSVSSDIRLTKGVRQVK